jgi:hypothetical protein
MNGIVSPQWSPEVAYRLRQLINAGWSTAIIADKLSEEFGRTYTRNAIAGRMDRSGLKTSLRPGGWTQSGGKSHRHHDPPIQKSWPASRERAVKAPHSPRWKPGRILARLGWLGL